MTSGPGELTRQAVEPLTPSPGLAEFGEVLRQLAHDINNPLAGIQNALLLVKDAVPPTHPHFSYLGAIEREIGRLARLTRRLAEAHRPARDDGEAAPAWVITDAMRRVEQSQPGKTVHFRLEIRHATTRLAVSSDLLWQAVYQLGQNAAEAAFTGATVEVSAWQDGADFCCSVRHPGPGRAPHSALGKMLAERAAGAIGGTLEYLEPAEGGGECRLHLSDRLIGEPRA